MKLAEVYRYEVAYRLRSPSTWIYGAFLLLVAFVMVHPQADGSPVLNANAPESIARLAVIAGLVGILVSAALFGESTIRDFETEMNPLLFTSPITKVEYLGGRFLAAFVVNAVILLVLPLGHLLATVMPYMRPEAFGPIRLVAYLQAYVLFILPNLFITGALLFAIAALVRQTIPVYLGAIVIFIGYLSAMGALTLVDSPMIAAFGDVMGVGTLNRLTEFRPPAERNGTLVGFPAPLIVSRVVWIAIASGILVLLHRQFRFAHDGIVSSRKADPEPVGLAMTNTAAPATTISFGFRTRALQTFDIARRGLAEVAGNGWFIVLMVGLTGLTMLFGWETTENLFDSSTWPATIYMFERVMDTPLTPITYLLISVFCGELVWKNREVGAAEIADAAPVPTGLVLLGRFLALAVVIVVLQLPVLVGGMLAQALQGYYDFEVGLYLTLLFGMRFPDLLMIAAMATVIHVVLNQKYVGHLVVLLTCIGLAVLRENGFVRHNMLRFNGDPGWTYSAMNGFGEFAEPFAWFKVYWGAWSLLLGVVATMFWIRGKETGLKQRLAQARARFHGRLVTFALAATMLVALTGGFVFYNTNILNDYHGPEERAAATAEYEKRFGQYRDSAQPMIVDAKFTVELFGEEPAAEMKGSFGMVNLSGREIDSVLVYLDPNVEMRSLSLTRPARQVLEDRKAGMRFFALDRPLAPGDSVRLTFDVAYRPRGFMNGGVPTAVVENGAYFHRTYMPMIGYQTWLELTDRESRKENGLAPQPPLPAPTDANARRFRWTIRDADLVQVDMTIGTAEDQTALTSGGILRRTWTENGRRYFHYVTDRPISFAGTVFSGAYALTSDKWRNVGLSIYHHPRHEQNLDGMIRSMKASLEYFSAEFGAYPDTQLRIVEVPRYGPFGTAHPTTISFAEDAFLTRVKKDEIDLAFYGTSHEVAHAWWGGMIRGGAVRGQSLLTESLANYSAIMVTEKTFGIEMARSVYRFQMERYLIGRSAQSREVPLLEMTGQGYLSYRKGAVAMYRLREELGEQAVNAALKRYFNKFVNAGPPYPTSLDLYAELKTATPDSMKYLLKDLFETITLWDVKTERATTEKLASGEYQVTLEVMAKKVLADSLGKETEIAMDEPVEIGAFASGKDGALGESLYLTRHRIRSGKQTIRFTVGKEPARAGIDPSSWLIDRNRIDNMADAKPPT